MCFFCLGPSAWGARLERSQKDRTKAGARRERGSKSRERAESEAPKPGASRERGVKTGSEPGAQGTRQQNTKKGKTSRVFFFVLLKMLLEAEEARESQNGRRSWFLELAPLAPGFGRSFPDRCRLWGLAPGSLPALGLRSQLAPGFGARSRLCGLAPTQNFRNVKF